MGRIIPNANTWVGFALTAPVLSPPTIGTATPSGTGGTLAAGTYKYVVTATNKYGETLASAEASATTTGSTSSVALTWTAVTGASNHRIYRTAVGGGTGTEQFLFQVSGVTATYTDTGSITPSGPLPLTNSAYDLTSPSVATDIADAIDLTHLVISLNASATGNVLPTPAFDSLFETSTVGTSQATFSGDFYRDDVNDLAWNTLPRRTKGFFLITRYGGRPTAAGAKVEVWPVTVTSRSMANMANNTIETFTVTCSVPLEPEENAVTVS